MGKTSGSGKNHKGQTLSIYRADFPEIFRFIEENKIPIRYFPEERLFALQLIESSAYQAIYYCPWTGKKLPTPLCDEFIDFLESERLSILEPEKWPKELRGESWWIKRGL